jgi:hypothetical protein
MSEELKVVSTDGFLGDGPPCDNPECNGHSKERWSSSEVPGYWPWACSEECAKKAFDYLKKGVFPMVEGNYRMQRADGSLGHYIASISRCPNTAWHHVGSTCRICGLKG